MHPHLHGKIWRAQFQKAITPLFVKIELLVPMCSATPLVSRNQTIFSKELTSVIRYIFSCYFFSDFAQTFQRN